LWCLPLTLRARKHEIGVHAASKGLKYVIP
jgi:hypothetical protein